MGHANRDRGRISRHGGCQNPDCGTRCVSHPAYPIEDHYGYSIEKLLEEEVAFFVMRHDGIAAGCSGIKLFGTAYGEIKRMYVRPPLRGIGLGMRMLEHLTTYALDHGVYVLRLLWPRSPWQQHWRSSTSDRAHATTGTGAMAEVPVSLRSKPQPLVDGPPMPAMRPPTAPASFHVLAKPTGRSATSTASTASSSRRRRCTRATGSG